MSKVLALSFLLAVAWFPALADSRPTIAPNGIVNAASLVPDSAVYPVAAGSLVTIFGQNLAPGTSSAGPGQLPAQILGTSVLINGAAAPLLFGSPNQINFQMPTIAVAASLSVATTVGTSDAIPLFYGYSGAGLFTLNGTGCGPGAILNDALDGSVSRNSPSNSAAPGDFITVFGTGFGSAGPQWDGIPIPLGQLFTLPGGGALFNAVESFPDLLAFQTGVQSTFTGQAPLAVGVNQFNYQLPLDIPQGCNVPLQVADISEAALFYSQPVTLSIHQGGGQCVDPPIRSYGEITLVSRSVSGSQQDGVFLDVDALFPSSPAQQAPVPRGFSLQGFQKSRALLTCPIPGYRKLSAGTLSVQPAGIPAILTGPSPDGIGGALYHQTLSMVSLAGKTVRIASQGQADIAPLQISIVFGQDITNFTLPGSVFVTQQLPTFRWQGGDPNSYVNVSLIAHLGGDDYWNTCSVPASAGQCTLGYITQSPLGGPGFPETITYATPNAELVYSVFPDAAAATFAAAGLSTDQNIARWRIEHHFTGFAIQ